MFAGIALAIIVAALFGYSIYQQVTSSSGSTDTGTHTSSTSSTSSTS